jgi:hypothetical protein
MVNCCKDSWVRGKRQWLAYLVRGAMALDFEHVDDCVAVYDRFLLLCGSNNVRALQHHMARAALTMLDSRYRRRVGRKRVLESRRRRLAPRYAVQEDQRNIS